MKSDDDPSSPSIWLARARSNLILAHAGKRIKGVFLEDLCFDAQQAAEKALKAVCIFHSLDFIRTHSLSSLIACLDGGNIDIPENIREAAILTQYAVRTRYPGVAEPVGIEEYQQALLIANRVINWAEKEIEGSF